ncbi:MAG: hypothetical protein D6714_03005 [Bacteroidetes bacterium]|nr:MAG: hypothetical protein D6714_03005 [Bacteroidota bacterium]
MRFIKRILNDMIPVILGVLIALIVNDWKARADDRRFIRHVFDAIKQEMRANKAEFELVLPRHSAAVDSVRYYMHNNQVSVMDIVLKLEGIEIPIVRNTTWNSFLNTKMELIDFKTISVLTEIEDARAFMNLKNEKLMDFVWTHADSRKASTKRIFSFQLQYLIDSESRLLSLYDCYLETVDAKSGVNF